TSRRAAGNARRASQSAVSDSTTSPTQFKTRTKTRKRSLNDAPPVEQREQRTTAERPEKMGRAERLARLAGWRIPGDHQQRGSPGIGGSPGTTAVFSTFGAATATA